MSGADAPLVLSAVAVWELRLKWHSLDVSGGPKGPISPASVLAFAAAMDWELLALTPLHAVTRLEQPLEHKDPFDELLLVQAQVEGMRLLTRGCEACRAPVFDWRVTRCGVAGLSPGEGVVFGVWHHVGAVGDAVGVVEEGCYFGDVEDAGVVEAGVAEGLAVGGADEVGGFGEADGVVEHGALAGGEFGDAVVEGEHFAELGVVREFPDGGAVGDEAVVAAVGAADGDGDHLAFEFGEAGGGEHEFVVEADEVAEFLGAEEPGAEDVGNETGACRGIWRNRGGGLRGGCFRRRLRGR